MGSTWSSLQRLALCSQITPDSRKLFFTNEERQYEWFWSNPRMSPPTSEVQ